MRDGVRVKINFVKVKLINHIAYQIIKEGRNYIKKNKINRSLG